MRQHTCAHRVCVCVPCLCVKSLLELVFFSYFLRFVLFSFGKFLIHLKGSCVSQHNYECTCMSACLFPPLLPFSLFKSNAKWQPISHVTHTHTHSHIVKHKVSAVRVKRFRNKILSVPGHMSWKAEPERRVEVAYSDCQK